jgi:hypothetical protein
MMHLFSCDSPSLELNFCYPSLNLSCGYFLGKAPSPANSQRCLTYFPPYLNLSYWFHPKYVIRGSLGGDQSPLLPPEAGLNLNPGSYQTDGQYSPPFTGSCDSPGSIVHLRLSPQLTKRIRPSSGSSYPLAPSGIFSPWSRGCTPGTREMINHHLCNPG